MVCVCFSEWIQEYYQQYPDTTNLQAEIDEFMAKFDENKEQVCIMPGVMLTSDHDLKIFNYFFLIESTHYPENLCLKKM